MPFGRKRVGGYGTGRQRKFASLQLACDAKASTITMAPAKMARSVSLILIFHIFTMIVHDSYLYTFVFLSKHR